MYVLYTYNIIFFSTKNKQGFVYPLREKQIINTVQPYKQFNMAYNESSLVMNSGVARLVSLGGHLTIKLISL